ncbi:MAG: hypothetical protein IBJ10_08050 [Phycisphaerales bacterium]|nr:hypothetical protein [Phycisphaerales bacterium]
MFIRELANADALPALEATVRFAGARQKILAHNIANADTPDFVQKDVAPADFQRLLSSAVDRRRDRWGGHRGDLEWTQTRAIRADDHGGFRLEPVEPRRGLMFHDRNNRDVERLMQDMVENVGQHRVATELLRSRYAILGTAIAGRV